MQMTEAEVRGLCLKSREIFLSQPILLELEAPLKICGKNTLFNRNKAHSLLSKGLDNVDSLQSSKQRKTVCTQMLPGNQCVLFSFSVFSSLLSSLRLV